MDIKKGTELIRKSTGATYVVSGAVDVIDHGPEGEGKALTLWEVRQFGVTNPLLFERLTSEQIAARFYEAVDGAT